MTNTELDQVVQRVLEAKTWNDVLGIDNETSQDIVKKRYRTLCQQLHPDKIAPEQRTDRTHRAFVIVQDAYDCVSRRVVGLPSEAKLADEYRRYANHVSRVSFAWKFVDTRPKVKKRTGPTCKRHRRFIPCARCRELNDPNYVRPKRPKSAAELAKYNGY